MSVKVSKDSVERPAVKKSSGVRRDFVEVNLEVFTGF